MTVQRGSSGGPIVTAEGLVGMVVQDGGLGDPVSRALPIEVIAGNVKGWGLPLGYRRRSAGIQCEPGCLCVRCSGNQACAGPVRVILDGHSDRARQSQSVAGFLPDDDVEFQQPARDIRTLRQHYRQADPRGPASVDDYQMALRSIGHRYAGTDATNGSTRDRIVMSWVVRTTAREGSPATATIALLPPPPQLRIDPAESTVDYQAGALAIPINPGLVVNPSTETLREATVAISAGFLAGDRLALAPQRGIGSLDRRFQRTVDTVRQCQRLQIIRSHFERSPMVSLGRMPPPQMPSHERKITVAVERRSTGLGDHDRQRRTAASAGDPCSRHCR